jgi:putative acetyltransferase
MNIRNANKEDAPAIRDLVFGILKSYGLSPDPEKTDRDLDDIEKWYFQRGGVFAVLEEDGCIIGSYGLCRIDDQTCELRKMYLSAEHRGKGLGRHLLEDALRRAEELGFSSVQLETASVLKEAVGLYVSYGFAPYETDDLSARCDQAYRKELRVL